MSQQKTNAQKVFSETKIFTNFKIKNKMKNLKKLNLVELNAQEVKKIEGGLILWTKTIVGYLLSEFDSILEGNAAWKREHGIK